MKVELLGKGNMGIVHANCYKHIPGIEIVRQVGRINPQDLLNDSSIDAVDVCYPSEVHKEFVVTALNKGKHVFCETPLSITLEDADEMIAAANRNQRILMVGLLMRSIGEYQEIEKRVKSGELGKIRSAHAYRLSNYMTPESPANRPHYGDVISELMTFDVDYLNLLFGLPNQVSAIGEYAPKTAIIGQATATLEYDDATATIEASAIKPLDFLFNVGIRVEGERGTLDLKTVFKNNIPETTLTLIKNGAHEIIEASSHDPYEYELRYFKDCIEGKADPSRLAGERAREALQIVISIRNYILHKNKTE